MIQQTGITGKISSLMGQDDTLPDSGRECAIKRSDGFAVQRPAREGTSKYLGRIPLPLLNPVKNMKNPFFRMGSVCQNTPEIDLFDFWRFSRDRIYSQKT